MMLRYDWTIEEIKGIHDQPFTDLIFEAQSVHRRHFAGDLVQRSALLSVKTGECFEDCAYCAQSTHNCAEIEIQPLLEVEEARRRAAAAKASGATRFCMSAAWREVEDGPDFERLLEMVRAVHALGLETCCTLGMLSAAQAKRLKDAGCDYYNHNLDTSPEHYLKIITTHAYRDRLRTLKVLRQAGIKLCCGGIIGMGEQAEDRFKLLAQLAAQNPHPESVPVNLLMPIPGTPLEHTPPIDVFDYVRMVAAARIVLPQSVIRVAAGRTRLSDEAQALCFLAGANSIFAGEKLLTAPNPDEDHDQRLISRLGLLFASEAELRAGKDRSSV